jgi:hypothetical protein
MPGFHLARLSATWLIFFAICLGLGYPTLKRYDPALEPGVQDSRYYARLMIDGPSDVPAPWRYRGLLPVITRPIHSAVQGRTGSWDPRWVAFLLVNASLMAGAALAVFTLGWNAVRDPVVALVGSLLYLLNFSVSNFHLAGLVDSSEALLMPLLALALLAGRWGVVPLLIVAGTAAKESFLPLGVAFAVGWWLAQRQSHERRARAALWIASATILGGITVAVVQSLTDGAWVLPWQIELGRESRPGLVEGLHGSITRIGMFYTFAWLAPLAIFGWRELPRELLGATAIAMAATIVLGGWAQIDTGLPRPLFNAGGPVLSIAAAVAVPRLVQIGAVRERFGRSAELSPPDPS